MNDSRYTKRGLLRSNIKYMFTTDFGYQQLRSWVNDDSKKVAVIAPSDIISYVVSVLMKEHLCNPVLSNARRILQLANNTTVEFYNTEDMDYLIRNLPGPQYHYTWCDSVDKMVADICRVATRLGESPIALITN